MMAQHAQYEYVNSNQSDRVVIRDIGNHTKQLTITNDAEWIVEKLFPILMGRRLFYFDSEGDLSELLVNEYGKFGGYA